MDIIPVASRPNCEEQMIGAYTTVDGKVRLVTYRANFTLGFEGFVLETINIIQGNPGDTIKANVTDLHSIGHDWNHGSYWYYFNLSLAHLYVSKKYNEYSLIFYESHQDPNFHDVTNIYKIENDTMKFARFLSGHPRWFGGLSLSVDDDDKEDYIWGNGTIEIDGKPYNLYRVTSGNPATGTTIDIGYFAASHCGGFPLSGTIKAIGDVTGDGIGDLIEVEGGTCVTIFKGRKRQTASVTEKETNPLFTIHSSEPNPIGKDRNALLPITIAQSGNYTLTLYDISGKSIGEIFKGELPVSDIKILLTLLSYNLSAGFYTLRLSDGKHTSDRGILLTN